ncbi:hypothetical protein Goklo_007220, partial [Gossypium klotzschianum]|nr:hypothetical protein [Gossypium klotzschianum]
WTCATLLNPSSEALRLFAELREEIQIKDNTDLLRDMPKHDETATIPPFGEWDETDPTSGQKFTVIFEKKKEEKNDPSFTFPISAPPKSSHSSNFLRSKRPSPSFYS